jgi:hypothetical protein
MQILTKRSDGISFVHVIAMMPVGPIVFMTVLKVTPFRVRGCCRYS